MPELYEDLEHIWESFWQLNKCRQYGFGPCPLAAQEILAVSQLYGISTDDRLEYFELIKNMDREWLQWTSEQVEKGSK